MKALVFKKRGYIRAHLDTSLAFMGKKVVPQPEPLRCHGKTWPVGTKFTRIGGTKTSAGFEVLDFDGFEPLEYIGMFNDGKTPTALFRQASTPAGCFFGYIPTEWGLLFGTRAHAGRVIEMTGAKTLSVDGPRPSAEAAAPSAASSPDSPSHPPRD